MVMRSSSDPKTETSKPGINEAPSEKLGDSNSLGDSSTVWEDPAESRDKEKCGFCLFMKGGDCKDLFTSWEVCVEEAKKNKEDFVTECMEVTSTLYKCIVAHSDYYQPFLTAEKVVREEQVKNEMEEAEKNGEISVEEVAARKLD